MKTIYKKLIVWFIVFIVWVGILNLAINITSFQSTVIVVLAMLHADRVFEDKEK
jgi:hydrogenase-4 membrane subunit HyfE